MAVLSGGKSYTKTGTVHESFPDTGGVELTNGNITNYPTSATEVVGWENQNPAVRVDLGTMAIISSVRFQYSVWTAAGVYAPTQVVVEGSNNDSTYSSIGTFGSSGNWTTANSNGWTNSLAAVSAYRYVKFTFTRGGQFLFLGEVEISGFFPSTKTINGLALSSVKLINGLAIASVKSINGLS